MNRMDVLRCWAECMNKTGTEQEPVDRLVDVLNGLLSFPAAKNLTAYQNYAKRLEASRVRGFGVIDLTNTVLAVTDDLLRLGQQRHPQPLAPVYSFPFMDRLRRLFAE